MHLTPHDALLVIDMQIDFLLEGAPLQVHGGLDLIPGINALARRFDHVLCTQDWHPAGHISFASTHGKQPFTDIVETPYGPQVLWPDHCVQGTPGANLHPALDLPQAELILRKGYRKDRDSYSAFFENDRSTPTGLAAYLRERSLTRLFFTGVAYDFCVGHSATAAARLGFQSFVIEDLTAAVDLPGTVPAMNQDLMQAGVHSIRASEV
jgi:nicotinamidase/pyrazinamidase